MYWSFEPFHSPDYVLISAGGQFTDTDFADMLDELYRLDYWAPRTPILLDERGVDLSPATTEQLVNAAEYFLDQNAQLGYTKIAVLLRSHGAARVAERFGEAVRSQTKAVVEAFRDRKEAEAWLVR